jgi:hypothetical protein
MLAFSKSKAGIHSDGEAGRMALNNQDEGADEEIETMLFGHICSVSEAVLTTLQHPVVSG